MGARWGHPLLATDGRAAAHVRQLRPTSTGAQLAEDMASLQPADAAVASCVGYL
jgi:hypothetical protein